MKENMSQRLGLKVAGKVTYYALSNCISCVYLYPLISYAESNHLIDEVEVIMAENKEEYKKLAKPVREQFLSTNELSSPLIIMYNPESGATGLVKPEIVQECANELIQRLTRLGNDLVIEFLDGEFELELFFQDLLFKMASNLEPEKMEQDN